MKTKHAMGAMAAIIGRESSRFFHQYSRLFSALVRPLLWLLVFAAGFQNVFGMSVIPPYETYILYQEYVIPGLAAMVLLFYGMQSSLSMVYDREMGMMRLLLTAPLPRWWLLFAKLVAGTILGVGQVYAFLLVAFLMGIEIPAPGYLAVLPALVLSGMMLGALGLLLSVNIRQLENFAGTMNFVIFPMFFMSSALFPLWKFKEAANPIIYDLASINPFTYAVELIRFAAYLKPDEPEALLAAGVVAGCTLVFFALAVLGYDPQRGLIRRTAAG